MNRRFRSYLRNGAGNTSVLFALAVVPLLLAAGSAIDYLRYADARTDIQSALDGAALAAALPADMTDAQRVAVAKDYFKKNLRDLPDGMPEIDVTIAEDTVAAVVDTTIPTTLMAIGGIDKMIIHETTEIMRPFAGNAEVVLVLDYSKSMEDNNKYKRMTSAAKDMITSLDDAIDDGKLKVGLVPFSGMVYTSMPKDYVSQSSATSTWTGCTQDRKYPHNTSVATPDGSAAAKWGYYDNNSQNTGSYSCANYASKNLKIIPLTADTASVKTKLSSMAPLGYTNIPLGAEFGWNLLDPALPYSEGADYSDKMTRKFLILLTDGLQTSNQWGEGDTRRKENGGPNLLALCKGMRDAKITVFTIAYDVKDPEVTTLLSDCAPGRYFEPDVSSTAISQVFSQITRQIKNRIARVSK